MPLGETQSQKPKVVFSEKPENNRKENRRDSRKTDKVENNFDKRGSKNIDSANIPGGEEKLPRVFEDVNKPSQGSSGSLNKMAKGSGSPKGKDKLKRKK